MSAASTPGCSKEPQAIGEAGIEPAWWAHETPLEPPPVHSPGSRAGRSRTCLPPRIRRLPRRSASARRERPVRDSNPSRLRDKQVATPAASQGNKSAWRESNPPVRHGEPVPGPLGHRRTGNPNSKGGRSRTLCVRVGAALLSQEHALVNPAAQAGLEPATVRLTGVRSTV